MVGQTYSQAMPSTLHVSLHPLLDGLDVVLGILELISDVGLVAVENVGFGSLIGFRVILAPATMLQTRAQVPGQRVTLRGLEIHVVGSGRRVVVEERVLILHLSSICVHATSRLARLDVTPHHGCHVALIVHEARVKVGSRVGVSRLDVSPATGERILEKVEHGEKFSRRPTKVQRQWLRAISKVPSIFNLHEHMVAEPTRDHRIVHHRLVGLLCEIRLPAVLEMGSWPGLKLFQFFLRRADLNTRLDTIGG